MKRECQFLYKIQNLQFSYTLGKQKILAIRSLNLEIPSSSLITISGPSGSGKSTLLNLLGLIEPVQQGKLFFQDENVGEMSEKRKNAIRKFEIGFIFQQFHLMPILSAEENVRYFLSHQKISKKEMYNRTEEALQMVGLWEHRKKRPSELSGGQKQRVAIARAIAKKPLVIIGDEPTASLDQKTGREIMEILKKMGPVILTTHDPMIQSFGNFHYHLVDGEVDPK
ncbi:MAG TPA: ABC transporter ATP-binding protein [Chlamydiales bacterium]|nr:ABC transporter ATP-binding protein [Chlamydiales bacterium]